METSELANYKHAVQTLLAYLNRYHERTFCAICPFEYCLKDSLTSIDSELKEHEERK